VSFVRYPSASGYFRVEVLAPDGSPRVIANPIYVTLR
jgi:hypothetical protein